KPRGRPPVPTDLRRLIAEMTVANRTWGEERIAAELPLKLGIRVSPRTVSATFRVFYVFVVSWTQARGGSWTGNVTEHRGPQDAGSRAPGEVSGGWILSVPRHSR